MILRSSTSKTIIYLLPDFKPQIVNTVFNICFLPPDQSFKREKRKGMVKWVQKGSQNKSNSLSSITRQAQMPRYTSLSSPRCTSLKSKKKKPKPKSIWLPLKNEHLILIYFPKLCEMGKGKLLPGRNCLFLLEKHPGIQEVNTPYVQLLYTRKLTLLPFFSEEKIYIFSL